MILNYWTVLGLVKLITLTYQDYAHKMIVDDRHNYFMFGATVGLIALYKPPFLYLLGIIFIVILLSFFINHFKLMGGGDVKTIIWSFTGFGVINFWAMIYYILLFALLLVIQFSFKRYVIERYFKVPIFYEKKVPAYILFLLSFIAIALLF